MGRSSHEESLRNRSKIVDCASKLFRRLGVESVSVADVMKAIGMTAGGFYKHFTSKDALVQEAVSQSFEQAADHWSNIALEHDGPSASAAAIVQLYFNNKSLDQTCPMLAFAGHVTSGSAGALTCGAYCAGTKRLFSQFMGRKGRARECDAKVMFAAMVGAGFLAHVVGKEKWVLSLQEAVEALAVRNAAKD